MRRPSGDLARWSWLCYVLQENDTACQRCKIRSKRCSCGRETGLDARRYSDYRKLRDSHEALSEELEVQSYRAAQVAAEVEDAKKATSMLAERVAAERRTQRALALCSYRAKRAAAAEAALPDASSISVASPASPEVSLLSPSLLSPSLLSAEASLVAAEASFSSAPTRPLGAAPARSRPALRIDCG